MKKCFISVTIILLALSTIAQQTQIFEGQEEQHLELNSAEFGPIETIVIKMLFRVIRVMDNFLDARFDQFVQNHSEVCQTRTFILIQSYSDFVWDTTHHLKSPIKLFHDIRNIIKNFNLMFTDCRAQYNGIALEFDTFNSVTSIIEEIEKLIETL